jgi:MFS family permease
LQTATSSPTALFNALFILLSCAAACAQFIAFRSRRQLPNDTLQSTPVALPAEIQALANRFLPIFWLLRLADWLQGPYFYAVYSSKVVTNNSIYGIDSIALLFLTGFCSTAIFGPFVGRFSDTNGRKKGTLAFTALYSLGALSTKSSLLSVLLAGRVFSGIGTALLFSAPESWLIGEFSKVTKTMKSKNEEKEKGGEVGNTINVDDGQQRYLGGIFASAYAGDSIVAILAGQLASIAVAKRGGGSNSAVTAPFELSVVFLTIAAILTMFAWKENYGSSNSSSSSSSSEENPSSSTSSMKEAFRIAVQDKKIFMVSTIQALFEGAMYIFVLQWPPAVRAAISSHFGSSADSISTVVPYGTIFSSFMICCLFGSTVFRYLSSQPTNKSSDAASSLLIERSTVKMLTLAAVAMSASALGSVKGNLYLLITAFFLFESCVGMYFPSIGMLRSRYIPDENRGIIMNLAGIPLNALVVSVFVGLKYIGGVNGALSVASCALAGAACAALSLVRLAAKEGGGKK